MSARQDPRKTDSQATAGSRSWRLYGAVVAAILALILILQNSDETRITFLFAETELPLFFALIISTLLGVIIGWLAPRVRRGSRPRD
jgi:uncharacterized integral membrane protein